MTDLQRMECGCCYEPADAAFDYHDCADPNCPAAGVECPYPPEGATDQEIEEMLREFHSASCEELAPLWCSPAGTTTTALSAEKLALLQSLTTPEETQMNIPTPTPVPPGR